MIISPTLTIFTSIKNQVFESRKISQGFRCELGSISPLISGLFLILMVLSAGLVNLSDSYLAKRELIQIIEPQVQAAIQSIDLTRYYTGDQFLGFEKFFGQSKNRVPIDCREVVKRVTVKISQSFLRNGQIKLTDAICSEEELSIEVSSKIHPIIDFPLFNGLLSSNNSMNGEILIKAKVGATSIYQ